MVKVLFGGFLIVPPSSIVEWSLQTCKLYLFYEHRTLFYHWVIIWWWTNYQVSLLCVCATENNDAFESLLEAWFPFTHIICVPIFVVNLPCSESDICRNDQDFGDNQRPKILKLLKYLNFQIFILLANACFVINHSLFIVVLDFGPQWKRKIIRMVLFWSLPSLPRHRMAQYIKLEQ